MIKIKLILLIQIFILFLFGCGGVDNENLNEIVMRKINYNPEQSQFNRIFLDDNNDLHCVCIGYVKGSGSSLSGTPSFYNIFEDKTIGIEIPETIELYASEIGNQHLIPTYEGNCFYVYKDLRNKITNFVLLDKNNIVKDKFEVSEIEGLEKNMDEVSFMCEMFSLEDGNIFIVTGTFGNEYKCVTINPIQKEIVSQFIVEGTDEGYLLKSVSQNNVVFYDWFNNKIIIYDAKSGENKNELVLQNSKCEGVCEFENYIYALYDTGIYRVEVEGDEFEIVIDANDTNYLNEKFSSGNILVESYNEIYVSFDKGMNQEGTSSTKYFVKYNTNN